MTILEAIQSRHSVRKYSARPIPADIQECLQEKIAQVNAEGRLHIQLVTGEPKSFQGIHSYGFFHGVQHYFVVAGQTAPAPGAGSPAAELDERAGYYGEQLVLLAQQLGLNTCWVGATYRKIPGTFTLREGEKVVCYIAVGYGETAGSPRRRRSPAEISDLNENSPEWYRAGVEAALLAPTALNQQRFYIKMLSNGFLADCPAGKPQVSIRPTFSLAGYTHIDLGIVKLHFEIGAGHEHFEWA